MAPGIKMQETRSPCRVGERVPNVEWNAGIKVMGPMEPVSNLFWVLKSELVKLFWKMIHGAGKRISHPKAKPPMEVNTAHKT